MSTQTDWTQYPQAMLGLRAREAALEKMLGGEFSDALRKAREALVCCERCYDMSHKRTEDGSSDGSSGTSESGGHPEN